MTAQNQLGTQERENGSLNEGTGCDDRKKWTDSRITKYGGRRKKETLPT